MREYLDGEEKPRVEKKEQKHNEPYGSFLNLKMGVTTILIVILFLYNFFLNIFYNNV